MSEQMEKMSETYPGYGGQDPRESQSAELNELAAALAKAQGAIKGASKDTTNPHFKSKYADLASVWEACRAPLSQNQLAVIQTGATVDGGYVMRTRLVHSSGQWIEGEVPCITAARSTNEMQALGSAITYARRYGLMSMVGIAPDDDDGNAAGTAKDKVWAKEEDVEAWNGPLGKHALKQEMRKFAEDLKNCTDSAMLAGLLESYKDVHLQCSRELGMEKWWDGAAGAISKKQDELRLAEANPLDA